MYFFSTKYPSIPPVDTELCKLQSQAIDDIREVRLYKIITVKYNKMQRHLIYLKKKNLIQLSIGSSLNLQYIQFYKILRSLLYLINIQMQDSSPQQIRTMFHQMGVLLLLDSPEFLEFGIDNITWQVGTKFKGIKLIPLGTHIIAYSLKNQNYMFPIKRFIYFGSTHKETKDQQRIRVFRWSTQYQKFVPLKGEQADGYRQGVKKYHFDCYLGAYPSQNVQFWATNTKYITKQVLQKLDPIQSYENAQEQYQTKIKKHNQNEQINIDSQSEGEGQQISDDVNKQFGDMEIDEPEQEQKKQQKNQKENVNEIKRNKDFGGNIYYSQIPRKLTQSSIHTTQINLDRTEILETILKTEWPKNQFGILGELQYSYIYFLIGQCLDSYNQWKKLMILLSSSETAFNSHKNLMLQFIVVFYQQVKQFPEDFFFDQLAKDNFLTICLKNLKIFHKQRNVCKKALSRIQKLLVFIDQKFKFQVQEQQEQENPIVVMENQSYF